MPAAPYPTLSGGGYIYDPPQKIEWIFADYVAAKHSQSTIFFGGISSLSYDEYAGNYDGMTTVEIWFHASSVKTRMHRIGLLSFFVSSLALMARAQMKLISSNFGIWHNYRL